MRERSECEDKIEFKGGTARSIMLERHRSLAAYWWLTYLEGDEDQLRENQEVEVEKTGKEKST